MAFNATVIFIKFQSLLCPATQLHCDAPLYIYTETHRMFAFIVLLKKTFIKTSKMIATEIQYKTPRDGLELTDSNSHFRLITHYLHTVRKRSKSLFRIICEKLHTNIPNGKWKGFDLLYEDEGVKTGKLEKSICVVSFPFCALL